MHIGDAGALGAIYLMAARVQTRVGAVNYARTLWLSSVLADAAVHGAIIFQLVHAQLFTSRTRHCNKLSD